MVRPPSFVRGRRLAAVLSAVGLVLAGTARQPIFHETRSTALILPVTPRPL